MTSLFGGAELKQNCDPKRFLMPADRCPDCGQTHALKPGWCQALDPDSAWSKRGGAYEHPGLATVRRLGLPLSKSREVKERLAAGESEDAIVADLKGGKPIEAVHNIKPEPVRVPTCEACGEEIIGKRKGAKTCSDVCRKAMSR